MAMGPYDRWRDDRRMFWDPFTGCWCPRRPRRRPRRRRRYSTGNPYDDYRDWDDWFEDDAY